MCSDEHKQRAPEGSQLTCFIDLAHGFLKKEVLHENEPQVLALWTILQFHKNCIFSNCFCHYCPEAEFSCSGVSDPRGFHRE